MCAPLRVCTSARACVVRGALCAARARICTCARLRVRESDGLSVYALRSPDGYAANKQRAYHAARETCPGPATDWLPSRHLRH
jgi:hypothetical protein